ncbi:MAG TPA: hypothetical protein VJ866_24240 [Pyrinomonadaceae bacterium]|nr:hypothetical protein [Pyrinomonadaceae bacterium]
MKEGLELEDVVLLGRTFEEYAEYFSLRDFELGSERLLDMASGVSSFCAEASRKGYDVVAADPVYGLPAHLIARKCEADLEEVFAQLPGVAHNYDWTFYRDIAHLKSYRERASGLFLRDYGRRPDAYVNASLPETPFRDGEFTVSLVSHFLFLYDDRLDYEFHRRSLLELSRITRDETRIYPLANLRARRSPFVSRLSEDEGCSGLEFEVRKIGFKFLKNSDELLIIRRRG